MKDSAPYVFSCVQLDACKQKGPSSYKVKCNTLDTFACDLSTQASQSQRPAMNDPQHILECGYAVRVAKFKAWPEHEAIRLRQL